MQDQVDFEMPVALLGATDQSWIDGRKEQGPGRSMSHKNPTDDSSLGDTEIAARSQSFFN